MLVKTDRFYILLMMTWKEISDASRLDFQSIEGWCYRKLCLLIAYQIT